MEDDECQAQGVLFQWLSKESVEQRRKEIKEEMSKGYFDDFRTFRESNGKIFGASKALIPKHKAESFPTMKCQLPNGETICTPHEIIEDKKAVLVCVSFREGAKDLLLSWRNGFGSAFQGTEKVSLSLLSVVEHKVMSLWPFKTLLLRGSQSGTPNHSMPFTSVYHFGNGKQMTDVLGASNKLTAYAVLLDQAGLVRWKASGKATEDEMEHLIQCTKVLLDEN